MVGAMSELTEDQPLVVTKRPTGRPTNESRLTAAMVDRLEQSMNRLEQAREDYIERVVMPGPLADPDEKRELTALVMRGINAVRNAGGTWEHVGEAMRVTKASAHQWHARHAKS